MDFYKKQALIMRKYESCMEISIISNTVMDIFLKILVIQFYLVIFQRI